MRLRKDRKGITGVMDAMIFITIMMIVFAGMYTINTDHDDDLGLDASDISEQILSSKFSLCDITDSEDTVLVSAPDLFAASVISGDQLTIEYLTDLLDAASGLPGSYKMTLTYKDHTMTVGNGDGTPVSKCTKSTTVTYGDQLITVLELF